MEQLMEAAQTGSIEHFYATIRSKPDILDGIDEKLFVETPLHVAASVGNTQFALEMMSLKPSMGKKLNLDGLSPLHLALQNGHSDTVKRLVALDSELVRVKGRGGMTPLHYAAGTIERDNEDIMDLLAELLYACPASVNDSTIQDNTSMHIAVKNYNTDGFGLLLQCLLKTNNQQVLLWGDEHGNTVLHIAVKTQQNEIVKLLVDNARSITNEQNSEGSTALDIACDIAPNSAQNPDPKHDLKKLLKRGFARRSDRKKKDSVATILNSQEKWFEVVYRIVVSCRKNLTLDMINVVLVVAVLITTATYQAILSNPAGISTAALFSTTNTTTVQKSSRNSTTTNAGNPLEIVPFNFHGQNFTNETLYSVEFYLTNTVAFTTSITVIMIVLPWESYSYLLHGSLLFMAICYGLTMLLTFKLTWIAYVLLYLSVGVPLLSYYIKLAFWYLQMLIKVEMSWTWLRGFVFCNWLRSDAIKRLRILDRMYR